MNNQEEKLDLLDLEDDNEVDVLPEATPFSAPRPKRPWLLLGLGVAIVILATWIVIMRVGGDSSNSVKVDLDAPVEKVEVPSAPVADLKVPEKTGTRQNAENVQQKPAEIVKPVESDGNPVRVVEDRKEITFNPDKSTLDKYLVNVIFY